MTQGLLFLGGGGDADISAPFDTLFFEKLPQKAKILYLPQAWHHGSYAGCLEWFRSLVHSCLPQAQITMLDEKNLSIDFMDFDAVYIGGGNTYKLLDFLVQNDLGKKLKTFIEAGKLIYGGSAGAIIFGSTIATVVEEKENYSDNKALDWCDGYAVRCHYTPDQKESLIQIAHTLRTPVYALPEDSGLIFNQTGTLLETIGDVSLFQKE